MSRVLSLFASDITHLRVQTRTALPTECQRMCVLVSERVRSFALVILQLSLLMGAFITFLIHGFLTSFRVLDLLGALTPSSPPVFVAVESACGFSSEHEHLFRKILATVNCSK